MKQAVAVVLIASVLIGVFLLYCFSSIYPKVARNTKEQRTTTEAVTQIKPNALARLQPHLQQIGLTGLPTQISMIGLKEEQRLEVYAQVDSSLRLLKTYPFTAFSGQLGPKLKEGDRQIPEGIYQIEYLNPNSAYHLSMKINYPNVFDKAKAKLDNRTKLGNDIFIHGKAVTIGCIPIGDKAIEELFLLVQHAFLHTIPVIISPKDFRKQTVFPKIESIDWEIELYTHLKEILDRF